MNLLIKRFLKQRLLIVGLIASPFFFTSCDDDSTVEPSDNNVPATYSFENVDYSGQTIRQDMLQEWVDYMKTANTPGVELSHVVMGNMYANIDNPFSAAELNESGKQLLDKTEFTEQVYFQQLILDFAQDTEAAGDTLGDAGRPGVINSVSGSNAYFFSAKGKEYTQLIEKGLMGAVFYHQIANVYLTDTKIGDGIALADKQHHWDEAFGYLGMPEDYPNGTGRFLGKYIIGREDAIGSATKIMDAIIAGRHAINNGNESEKSAQAAIVVSELERAIAATGVHYLNSALNNLQDPSIFLHAISEAEAFIFSLKFNDNKSISGEEIDSLLASLGDDYYELSPEDINGIKDILVEKFNLQDVADSL